MDTIYAATIGLNAVSALCAVLVVAVYLLIRFQRSEAIDRVSIRLQTGIALVDFLKHIAVCFSLEGDESFACTFIGFVLSLLFHIYLCLNICVALNLHLVIIKSKMPCRKWEYCYWTVSLIIPLLLNLPLLALDLYGGNSGDMCLVKHGPLFNDIMEVVYSSIVSLATIMYCILISTIVVIKANKQVLKPRLLASGEQYTLFSLRTLICRTCLYPIACFLSCIGANLAILHFFFIGPNHILLKAWALCSFSTMGILNLAAFLADPLVFKSLPKIFKPPPKKMQHESSKFSPVTPTSDFSYNQLINSDDAAVTSQAVIRDFQTYI
ncbi:hypothetical protein DSO57_1001586 [Entomophthora muscae]|uniref:Uncharacterized protein n=1 Tax=Entomophthora muscae TaxID=34485 RepID=A0ACC2SB35_9FUNG|nr:hypothetical protein DSO57_1001586 [Entomophthora muscae]